MANKILIILFFISIVFNILQYNKNKKVKRQIKNMDFILTDMLSGEVGHKILASNDEITSDIVYKINAIVYKLEKEISDLKIDSETNKELMTSLSHDLRTPLTTLIGYLDAIDKGVVNGKEREEYFQIARSKAYDLKEYIDILFEWFKLQSSEIDLLIEKVEIIELTRRILRDWIPILEENDIDFEIDMPERPIFIKIDRDKYGRIINNLLQNVISHSKASKLYISISNNDRRVFISIQDNGIGISETNLPYIFDRLYKCDAGRSRKGSGLGLAIVKQMVEVMQGEITVESKEGEFTNFIIQFNTTPNRYK